MYDNYCIFCQKYREEIKQLKSKIFSLEGWQGEDNIEILRLDENTWEVSEHRKVKETNNVNENRHKISHGDVLFMKQLILDEPSEKIKARKIWERIIFIKQLEIDIDSFNGGKNRARFYFPLYYYPIKILEHFKFIDYKGNGIIIKKGLFSDVHFSLQKQK